MLKVEYFIVFSLDGLDIFFIVFCSILLAIVYISSFYDERLRVSFKKSLKVTSTVAVDEHYKIAPPTLGTGSMSMISTDEALF